MKKLILAISLLAVSSSAMAQWIAVYGDGNSISYVDPALISKKGDIASLTSLGDFTEYSRFMSIKFASVKTQREFDCKNKKYRTIGYTTFAGHMGKGIVVSQNTDSLSSWSGEVKAHSESMDLLDIACATKKISELAWSNNKANENALNDAHTIKAIRLLGEITDKKLQTLEFELSNAQTSLSIMSSRLLLEPSSTDAQRESLFASYDRYKYLNSSVSESKKQILYLLRFLTTRLKMKSQSDKVHIASYLQNDSYEVLRAIDDLLKQSSQINESLLIPDAQSDPKYVTFVSDYKSALMEINGAIISNPRAFKP
jgi:hypothetical protein